MANNRFLFCSFAAWTEIALSIDVQLTDGMVRIVRVDGAHEVQVDVRWIMARCESMTNIPTRNCFHSQHEPPSRAVVEKLNGIPVQWVQRVRDERLEFSGGNKIKLCARSSDG